MNLGGSVFHDRVGELARDVAGEIILPRFKTLETGDIRSKTHAGDLVTIADEEAEQRLTERLHDLVPGSRVVGEEGVAKNAAVLELLASDDPVWLVDPIDGTSNFVNGIERFAMMMALVRRSETLMGWIYDPLNGTMLHGERGAGAWLMAADGTSERRSIPAAPARLADMDVAIHHRAFGPHLGVFNRNLRLGSAAHDYWSLVDGRIQALSYRRLKPWDHAAGSLIHAEAGGYGRLLTGEVYKPTARETEGMLCAPTREIWSEIAALAKGKT
jgi:fructose-1,6-bisphosphatase/inositol monophosphatase family enzyme